MPSILEDATAEILNALEKQSKAAMNKIGRDAVNRAKELAPVDEGDLRDSIKKKVKGDDVEITLEVGASDYKAHWHEFGTEKMQKHPFIEPATKDMPKELETELIKRGNRIKTRLDRGR